MDCFALDAPMLFLTDKMGCDAPHFEPVHQMKRAYRRKNDGELHRFAQKLTEKVSMDVVTRRRIWKTSVLKLQRSTSGPVPGGLL